MIAKNTIDAVDITYDKSDHAQIHKVLDIEDQKETKNTSLKYKESRKINNDNLNRGDFTYETNENHHSMTNEMCDSNKENNTNIVKIGIYIVSQMGLPEGWKVTKTRKDYDITHPDGIKFSGDIDSLAGYLGIRIYYNRRIYQGTTEFKSISLVDNNNNGAQDISKDQDISNKRKAEEAKLDTKLSRRSEYYNLDNTGII